MSPTYLFTRYSGNAKTGPLAVTTSPRETCPTTCALYSKCYPNFGSLRLHWDRISKGVGGVAWDAVLRGIKKLHHGELFRMNQAGDFNGHNNALDAASMDALVNAAKGKRPIAYTHYPVLDSESEQAPHNRAVIKKAVDAGFNINLSANNPSHADELIALGIAPVVTVVKAEQTTNFKTAAGNRVVICPASVRDNVTCSSCGLCARSKRDYIIGFPAHGNNKRAIGEIASKV